MEKSNPESKGMGMRRDELPREVLRYADNLKQQIKDILGKHNLTIDDITNTPPLEETSSASTALSDFLKDPKWNSLKKSPPDYKKLAELMNLLLKTVQTGEIPPEADPRETWDWKTGEKILFNFEKYEKNHIRKYSDWNFSSDGERWAAVIKTMDSRTQTIIVDGKPWILWFEECKNPVFSPDGKKVAAAISMGYNRRTIAVDGKKWENWFASVLGEPVFSPDGKKVAVLVLTRGIVNHSIAVNGEVWKDKSGKISLSNPVFSPDGTLAAAARVRAEGKTVFDGKKLWKERFHKCEEIVFSPDGKKIAAAVMVINEGGNSTVAVDGKTWEERFDGCINPVFSADGRHTAAVVHIGKTVTVAVDGKAWEEKFFGCKNPQFSPDGERVAVAVNDHNGWALAIDGLLREERFIDIHRLAWSPDGKKIMIVAHKYNHDISRIVMDV